MVTLAEIVERAIRVGECRRTAKLAKMLDVAADIVESAQFNEHIVQECLETAIHEFARNNHTQPF